MKSGFVSASRSEAAGDATFGRRLACQRDPSERRKVAGPGWVVTFIGVDQNDSRLWFR